MATRAALVWMVAVMAAAGSGHAAVNAVADLANPLDNTGGSARATGLGSAFVGVADDASALLWNPAGLSSVGNVQLALHHNSWLAGIIQETAVVGVPIGGWGSFGLSGNYVDYGTFSGYDGTGASTADYAGNRRIGIGAGWGMEALPGLSGGIALKESLQSVADADTSAFSADVGVLWSPMTNVRLGMAYANVGAGIAGHALASALRAGGSYRLDLADTNHALFALSGAFEPQGVHRVQVGAEDVLYSTVALRAGYQASLAENGITGLQGLSAGIGFMYAGFTLDYAYLPMGDLGLTQRVSLGYQFGQRETSTGGTR